MVTVEPTVRAVPLRVSLHTTVAWPWALMESSDTTEASWPVAYGAMISDEALRILVMSESAIVVNWLDRSASARAVIVTLRWMATAVVSSTLPRNSVIKIGSSKANSTAARPRRSLAKRARVPDKWRARAGMARLLMTRRKVRF